MRLFAIILVGILAVGGLGLLTGCCGSSCWPSPSCGFDPCTWWDPCGRDDPCAPIGDPCDCCDPRG